MRSEPIPGNVRELRNVLEKALAFTTGIAIEGTDILLGNLREESARPGHAPAVDANVPYDEAHDAFERAYLVELLKIHNLSVTEAAKAAGIHRQSIHRLLRKHGIKLDEYR
jgi:two-component system, NtrC family, response regulator AtoC